MSWASRKQFKYLSVFILVILIIIFIILYPIIFKDPTCIDNRKNGDETGIDCGGSCSLMCKADVSDPVVLWSRAFPVVGTINNLVAFIENRNKDSGVEYVSYEFRVYDKNNILLGRREGATFIPPNKRFAIFEPRFDPGDNEIKSVSFEFSSPLIWIKKDQTIKLLPISPKNIVFDDNKNTPKLSAIIENDSIYDIPEFEVIAVLYDKEGNAINASKTKKGKLLSGSSVPVVFTWPEALSDIPALKEVLISINPFSVSF